MIRLPADTSIRPATPADAGTIATQRGQMFVEMGDLTPEAATAEHGVWAAWLAQALESGGYVGFVAQHGAEVVAGVGLMLHPRMPTSTDPSQWRVYVMNMYVEPTHRRRGLAEALMGEVLAWARSRDLPGLVLHAAPMGRALYERLGFRTHPSPELRLTLESA